MDRPDPLIVITGPTAVGKSKLSIRLAKEIGGEIISADSMQVYRGMDIGTDKISREAMEGVEHFLIDELDPDEEFGVFVFSRTAKAHIEEIERRGHIPILVGGTGFYINAVVYNTEFSDKPDHDDELRDRLLKEAETEGADALFERLKEADPEYARVIHKNNVKKTVRALEYIELTGEKFSEYNERVRENATPAYNTAFFVLDDDREVLGRKIDARVDSMFERGLVDEVKALRAKGYDRGLTSMEGLGYKEILAYLDGECTLEEASDLIKRGTRLFAKRQRTWFKREKNAVMVDKRQFEDDNSILRFMMDVLKEKGII